jgi:hypothetical protein
MSGSGFPTLGAAFFLPEAGAEFKFYGSSTLAIKIQMMWLRNIG